MNRDHYLLKEALNHRAAQNRRMAALEKKYTPLFWCVIGALIVLLLLIRK
jgi:hypothetical protein